MTSSSGALEAVERILNRGGDPDDVLRGVLAALNDRGVAWAAIAFVEGGETVLGPTAGGPPPSAPQRHAVVFQGTHVADLLASPNADAALLERVATLISPHCLVGWDTGGEAWEP